MNDWIPSQVGLRGHPKTRRLARTLDIPVPHVIGHLHCLWYWALEYAPDGDLEDFELEDIADAAGWTGDAETFVTALVECGSKGRPGFLDRDDASRLCIHDWEENQGDEFRARIQAAAKKRAQRARRGQDHPPVSDSGDSVPEEGDTVPQTQDTVPDSRDLARAPKTGPDRTRPDQNDTRSPPDGPARARASPEAVVELFHELCPSLPRIRQLTDSRRRRLCNLPRRLGDVTVSEFFRRVEASDFLTGRTNNGRGWRADLDWICKPEHIPRILEGSYDSRASPKRTAANVARALDLVRRCQEAEAEHDPG